MPPPPSSRRPWRTRSSVRLLNGHGVSRRVEPAPAGLPVRRGLFHFWARADRERKERRKGKGEWRNTVAAVVAGAFSPKGEHGRPRVERGGGGGVPYTARPAASQDSSRLPGRVGRLRDNCQQRILRTTPPKVHALQAAGVGGCCVPTGCKAPLGGDDLSNAVRVLCNNQECRAGEFMHRECFDRWQESVLAYLSSCGRARSWSEKQRLQNLWSKKGYDLAFKACGCKCGKGHIRKDVDWVAPAVDEKKKRGRKKRQCDKPGQPPAAGLATGQARGNARTQDACQIVLVGYHQIQQDRMRSSSISSTGSGGCSPPMTPDQFASPIPRSSVNPFYCGDRSGNYDSRHLHGQQEVRMFSRRQDYSVFNCLPRNKINSYNIKVEDDDRSDEIRTFILTTLAQHRTTRLPCCVCHTSMMVFDRFPLVDGSLFLSPRQHSPGSVTVPSGPRGTSGGGAAQQTQYLNAVCMKCLDADWQSLRCVSCKTKWIGTNIIIGTLYLYDFFAAQPCCEERLRCNRCRALVIGPDQRAKYYFSDYSHSIACPSCKSVDYHFVKSLKIYGFD
ncbi:headcase protein-like [Tropilaelaps mercedesae]|uniref:Headcase protein-like n=1 Tax=Tropilaelaps mercedesae TaxID=418985 RepID=A0A1V9X6J3_9ACAR|nr:headcase protein-like [Tropilaelaps mercedesae]